METFNAKVGLRELSIPDGQVLKITQHTLRAEAQKDFRALGLAQLKGVILAIDWVVGKKHHVWGSAVMVAPGVAMTAGHVVRSMQEAGLFADGGGYLLALGFQNNRAVLWNPDSFTSIGDGDLAIITLIRTPGEDADTGEPIQVNVATIAARAPDVGEKVSLFGFAASENYSQTGSPIGLSHFGSIGWVREVYPERRDQRLPGPSACIDAKTVGGMSGGGAFDAEGRLIGIVSTGIGEEPTFISLVWPSLFTPLEIAWPPGLVKGSATISDLAKVGLSNVVGLEHVHSHVACDGTPSVSLEHDGERQIAEHRRGF